MHYVSLVCGSVTFWLVYSKDVCLARLYLVVRGSIFWFLSRVRCFACLLVQRQQTTNLGDCPLSGAVHIFGRGRAVGGMVGKHSLRDAGLARSQPRAVCPGGYPRQRDVGAAGDVSGGARGIEL